MIFDQLKSHNICHSVIVANVTIKNDKDFNVKDYFIIAVSTDKVLLVRLGFCWNGKRKVWIRDMDDSEVRQFREIHSGYRAVVSNQDGRVYETNHSLRDVYHAEKEAVFS